jgi:hypothetical protein
MPVSLGLGTVRTPDFSVKGQDYLIMIQVEKRLPFQEVNCMMGTTQGPLDKAKCSKEAVLLSNWTVWDGDNIVEQGANRTEDQAMFEDRYIYKFLGTFMAEAGKKYVVEVKFLRDGTALNVTNAHLIVVAVKDH